MKKTVAILLFQLVFLIEFSHQRSITTNYEEDSGPYRRPIPLMLHMDNNKRAPSFGLPNDEIQGGMQVTSQGGKQDTSQDGMQDMRDTQSVRHDTQGGMQDTQGGMQRDEASQWDFQRDMSLNNMLASMELQGGMQDSREKRLYLPHKFGHAYVPRPPKRKSIRWYQTRN